MRYVYISRVHGSEHVRERERVRDSTCERGNTREMERERPQKKEGANAHTRLEREFERMDETVVERMHERQ